MKFLVDAQLPRGLCVGLAARGHEGDHVADLLGADASDDAIVELAVSEGRIILTKDGDFALADAREGLRIIWFRVGNVSNRALIAWLEARWSGVEAALEAGEALIEVQ